LLITVPFSTPGDIIYIENQQIKAGILLNAGGRIIHFSCRGMENILKINESLLDTGIPYDSLQNFTNHYLPILGSSVWPSPMEEWWQKQNLDSTKLHSQSKWPPDPWLAYSRYKLIQHDSSSVIVEGPSSPVSGVAIRRKISLSDNKLQLDIWFTNMRDSAISWGIWTNTRLNGQAKCYIPVKDEKNFRIGATEDSLYQPLRYKLEKGYFSFCDPGELIKKFHTAKVYITPERPFMAAMDKNQFLIIEMDADEIPGVHPARSFIEIFNQRSEIEVEDLLELEHQSPYLEIRPGESIHTREIWRVYPLQEERRVYKLLKEIRMAQ
jgi:hypothetical protein